MKGFDFDSCTYFNVYKFMYTNYFLNMWFLIFYLILTISEIHFFQNEMIFNIRSTNIYIISFRLNNLVLVFIHKKLLMKYHNIIPITSF